MIKRSAKTVALLAAATSALLALSACAGGAPDAEGGEQGELLATIDTMYGAVEVPRPADGELTVVALGWSDGEVALSLGVKPVAIFDWQSFGEDNKGVGSWATDLFGDDTPTVIPWSADGLNYEQIRGFEPDLILNVRAAADEEVFERLSDIAPTIYGPEGTVDYAVDWRTHTLTIAEAIGELEAGEEQVAELEGIIETVRSENPQFEGVTLASGSKFGDAYGASLPGDSRFDIYAALGFALPEGIAALDAPTGFYAPVPVEQVQVLDADVAVLTTIFLPHEDLLNDPLIQSLPVVQDGRAVFVEENSAITQYTTAGTVLSLSLVFEEVVPLLQEAVAKLG